MKHYLLVATVLFGLFAIFVLKTSFPSMERLDTNPSSISAHDISTNPNRSHGIDHLFDLSSDSYLTTTNLDRLLSNSDLELNRILNGLSQIQVSSILNALGRMVSADINSRGDYTLANRLMVGLEHGNSAEILQWAFRSKSPLGCEFDFQEQTRLVSKFSGGKPSAFLQSKFLRTFGSLQGEEVARSGTTLSLNSREYLSYLEGVCDTSREVTFGSLELIRDNAIRELAVERAVTSLLTADAIGFSEYLVKLPPSYTRDLAVWEMIKWLNKENARAECTSWLQAIHSPTIKKKAEQAMANAP